MAKDIFSAQSAAYATFRPKLPVEVYAFMFQHVNEFGLAWDVGTGNGQTAAELAKRFAKVVATDISKNQLSHAVSLPNIDYRKEPSEHSSLDDASVDLVTIAQAIHWFDFSSFYTEVQRVAKKDAVIAAFTYTLFRPAVPAIDELVQSFYESSAPYWDPERKYVDEEYRTIPFPFNEIAAPVFYMQYEWNYGQLTGYMETWSANQRYQAKYGRSLLNDAFKKALQQLLPGTSTVTVKFPVHMRIGKL